MEVRALETFFVIFLTVGLPTATIIAAAILLIAILAEVPAAAQAHRVAAAEVVLLP